jgi:hypothetical protein
VLGLNSIGQENKTVLIIPFPSQQFFSYFDANTLQSINGAESTDILFKNFGDSLIRALSNYKKHFDFVKIPDIEYNSVKYYIDPFFKEAPVSHYGIDFLKIKNQKSFKSLCLNYEVDYVLFLTNYTIKKKLLSSSKSFEGSHFIAWSRHELNYELYDVEGNLIAMSDGFSIEPDLPLEENYFKKGLEISKLKEGFKKLSLDLNLKLNQYLKKGKAQFKSKYN